MLRAVCVSSRHSALQSGLTIRSPICSLARSLLPAPPSPIKPFIPSIPTTWKPRVAHTSTTAQASFKNASCKECCSLVQDANHTYLDVRTQPEYQAGHPAGAVCIPVFLKSPSGFSPSPTFVQEVEEAFPDKETTLVVGCQSGKRSLAASELLAGAGYSNVTNVEGGYAAWVESGLPVEK